MGRTALVTGGSGYFGTLLVKHARTAGYQVRIFDLHAPEHLPDGVDHLEGDVRDRDAVRGACEGADVVFHNVAQVPLAKDRQLFESVNVGGTANVLLGARAAACAKVVHTSSSAIYGIPERNPVDEQTPGRPLEAYGKAKLEAELLCREAAEAGDDVTIVRPRTILGHGRLGIMAMLFELVADGAPVFVIGGGANRYQFVHADDLAAACLLAAERPGPTSYNIGAREFGTMRETLQALVDHAGTGSTVRSLPVGPARQLMRASARLGLVPLAPYHWMLYGESLYFDTSKAETELGWRAHHANAAMVVESYEWFLDHRDQLAVAHGSHHQSPARLGALRLLKRLP